MHSNIASQQRCEQTWRDIASLNETWNMLQKLSSRDIFRRCWLQLPWPSSIATKVWVVVPLQAGHSVEVGPADAIEISDDGDKLSSTFEIHESEESSDCISICSSQQVDAVHDLLDGKGHKLDEQLHKLRWLRNTQIQQIQQIVQQRHQKQHKSNKCKAQSRYDRHVEHKVVDIQIEDIRVNNARDNEVQIKDVWVDSVQIKNLQIKDVQFENVQVDDSHKDAANNDDIQVNKDQLDDNKQTQIVAQTAGNNLVSSVGGPSVGKQQKLNLNCWAYRRYDLIIYNVIALHFVEQHVCSLHFISLIDVAFAYFIICYAHISEG